MRHLLFLCLAYSLFAREIDITGIVLDVEVAQTEEARRAGLSGRTELLEGKGMLFVFDQPTMCRFWMKDTKIPLAIGFFDANRSLIEWKEMPAMDSSGRLPTFSPSRKAKYALEVPKGWFQRHNVPEGVKFEWR